MFKDFNPLELLDLFWYSFYIILHLF